MTKLAMPERMEPKIVDKPWGREIWYAHTDRYAGKILEVKKKHVREHALPPQE